jgi:hypothetical protein
MATTASPDLRPGERVAFRPPDDILATLDADGTLAGVPFMPEMLQYFGRTFTVAKRVEKICDTICPVGSRRMLDTVFLEDLRCDGAAHGGCEAECRIYFKQQWLARVPNRSASPVRPEPAALARLAERAHAGTRMRADATLFRCQATEARRATKPLPTWDVRQYVREVRAGNYSLRRILALGLRVLWWEARNLARRPAENLKSTRGAAREQSEKLGLRTGDWVEVRSREEIARTLDPRGYNRGLYFSAPEMTPACGKQFRVRRLITRIIDEPTGRLLTMKHECVVLDGLVCTGERSVGRWFCAREIFPYWREAWLRRVAVAPAPAKLAANRRTVAAE